MPATSLRDTPAHYDSTTKVPPVGSDFEFYWSAFLQLSGDPDLPYSWGPIDVEGGADSEDSDSWEMLTRINTRLTLNKSAIEARIVENLRSAGVPGENLSPETRTAEAAELIERLIEADRLLSLEPYGGAREAMQLLLREFKARHADNPKFVRSITVRVVTAAQFLDERPKGAGELCAFLNANAVGPRVINRHHLRSVERTFRAELKETKHARIAQLKDDVIAMRALRTLKDTARRSVKHPHLRSLKGRRLSEAMNAVQDLRQAVFEAIYPRQISCAKAV